MNQDKRRIFEQHLKEQDRIREQQQEKKKNAELFKNNPQEDMLFIQKEFRNLIQQYQILVAEFKKGNVIISQLTTQHDKMKNYYLQINYVLTSYDRQFYKQTLQKINVSIFELRKKSQPTKKFKFSRRAQDFGVKEVLTLKQTKQTDKKQSNIAGIQNKNNQKIVVTLQCPEGGSFKIAGCENVEVDLLQKTEILFLKNLKNCIVRAAITKSTVFVDNCTDCKFELNCHQLRIHNTYQSKFGIYASSKPIIEDCNQVIFSPYSFNYQNRKQHEQQQQRSDKPNLWREIQDFNWLKENEISPHFKLEE